MKVEYWINSEDGWKHVDYETYSAFAGEKEQRPSTWRLLLAQSLLQGYRYV